MQNPIRDLCLKIKNYINKKRYHFFPIPVFLTFENGEIGTKVIKDKEKIKKFRNNLKNLKKQNKLDNHVTPVDLKYLAGIIDKPLENNIYIVETPAEDDLDEVRRLAGIFHEREARARSKATKLVFEHQIPIELKKIRSNENTMHNITKDAYSRAQAEIVKEEQAKAYADIMEKFTNTKRSKIRELEYSWSKYLAANKIKNPTAQTFGEFLVKEQFLTQTQVDSVRVPAIFVDEIITNAYEFYDEIDRVQRLY